MTATVSGEAAKRRTTVASLIPIPPPPRIFALDGLRGVAALIVVLWHAFMIAEPHLLASESGAAVRSFFLTTPAFLTLAGEEAVLVFFVLSGFAVTLPVLHRGRSFSWLAYYPARLIRLYIPAWISLIFAGLLLLLIPRQEMGNGQDWLARTNSESLNNVPQVLGQFTLWGGGGHFPLNNPLWSLSWEIAFSLLLPAFALLAWLSTKGRASWGICLALVLIAETYGRFGGGVVATYLPVFALGAILAANRDRLAEAANHFLTTHSRRLWSTLWVVGSLEALVLWHQVRTVAPEAKELIASLQVLEVIGALMLVAAVYILQPVRRILEVKPVRFLGKISFSLYLTHVPILLAYTYLLGWEQWGLALLLAFATMLPIALLFSHHVEEPAHRLGKRVGRALGGKA